ncbi:MAG: DHA2 family efflux MFS transporter permease subunit [Pseudomonadota bacterium]
MASIYNDPCQRSSIRAGQGNAVCPERDGPWVLAATALASSMVMIDGTAVNVILPILQNRLAASATELQWIVESYALFLAAFLLLGGALGDTLGRRRIFLIGVVVFALASLFCGLSRSPEELIIARAFQGFGGALLVPNSLAILGASFSRERRGRAIGIWSATTALSIAAGPVLGAWLAEQFAWPLVFYINLPVAAVVVWLALKHVPESRNPDKARLDYVGTALSTLGLGALIFGLIEAGHLGLSHPLVIGSMMAGVILLALFVVSQRWLQQPLVPLDLFTSRNFSGVNIMTLVLYSALSASMFLFPFNLIQVRGYGATEAAAAYIPFVLIMALFSPLTGRLVDQYGARMLLTIGPTITAVGFALYALPGPEGSYWTTYFPAIVVQSIGMVLTVTPLTTTVMAAVPDSQMGLASGINNVASRAAGLIAIALFGLIFLQFSNYVFQQELNALPIADVSDLTMQFGRIDGPLPTGDLGLAIQAAADRAFLDAFGRLHVTFAGMALASAAIAWFSIEKVVGETD